MFPTYNRLMGPFLHLYNNFGGLRPYRQGAHGHIPVPIAGRHDTQDGLGHETQTTISKERISPGLEPVVSNFYKVTQV